MSKYIVEFSDKPSYQEDNIIFYPCKQIQWWSVSKSNIDKLTPLDKALDEAYQRGLEDGKDLINRSCDSCRYETNNELTGPCSNCSCNFLNNWTPKGSLDTLRGMVRGIIDSGYSEDDIGKILEEMKG